MPHNIKHPVSTFFYIHQTILLNLMKGQMMNQTPPFHLLRVTHHGARSIAKLKQRDQTVKSESQNVIETVERKISRTDSHTMVEETPVEIFNLKCLFTCYQGNEHYCTCYLNVNIIQIYLGVDLIQNILLRLDLTKLKKQS